MKPIIKIENLSKQYRLGTIGTGTLSRDLNRWWHMVWGKEDPYLRIGDVNDRSTRGNSEFVWALRDINLEVMPGEVLGIIGKNGAGKSTLLKILSKVTGPTTGKIHFNGRIGSLLEVGTGFHSELTGRENIFLNGAILGMTKSEIRSKLDEIIDFSGCERYIDTPVKRYSTGMTVRLGFAVAAHLEPEILVVDEVLAVGDAEFQKKAIGKMQDVSRDEGRTVLFVSHNMGSIENLCSKALLLENGSMYTLGDVSSVIKTYQERCKLTSEDSLRKPEKHKGTGGIRIGGIQIKDEGNETIEILQAGKRIEFWFNYTADDCYEKVVLRVLFVSQDNVMMVNCNNYYSSDYFSINKGEGLIKLSIPNFPLPKGLYHMHLKCLSNSNVLDEIEYAKELNVDHGNFFRNGRVPSLKGGVFVAHQWEITS